MSEALYTLTQNNKNKDPICFHLFKDENNQKDNEYVAEIRCVGHILSKAYTSYPNNIT